MVPGAPGLPWWAARVGGLRLATVARTTRWSGGVASNLAPKRPPAPEAVGKHRTAVSLMAKALRRNGGGCNQGFSFPHSQDMGCSGRPVAVATGRSSGPHSRSENREPRQLHLLQDRTACLKRLLRNRRQMCPALAPHAITDMSMAMRAGAVTTITTTIITNPSPSGSSRSVATNRVRAAAARNTKSAALRAPLERRLVGSPIGARGRSRRLG